jgi:hypothetical protein
MLVCGMILGCTRQLRIASQDITRQLGLLMLLLMVLPLVQLHVHVHVQHQQTVSLISPICESAWRVFSHAMLFLLLVLQCPPPVSQR